MLSIIMHGWLDGVSHLAINNVIMILKPDIGHDQIIEADTHELV